MLYTQLHYYNQDKNPKWAQNDLYGSIQLKGREWCQISSQICGSSSL